MTAAAQAALVVLGGITACAVVLAWLAWRSHVKARVQLEVLADPAPVPSERLGRLTTDDLEPDERVSHFLHGLGTYVGPWAGTDPGAAVVRFDSASWTTTVVETRDLVRVDTPPSGVTRLSPDEVARLFGPSEPLDLASLFDPVADSPAAVRPYPIRHAREDHTS